MSFKIAVAALAASAQLSMAYVKPTAPAEGMRLIKTSEEDPGTWVTKDEIYKMFRTRKQNTGFVDITNIVDEDVLQALSTKARSHVNAVEYPTELSHVEEANELIATASTEGPKAWLDQLASYNNRHCESETGVEAAEWIYSKAQEFASNSTGITVEKFSHSDFDQPSVIVRIAGESDELVMIGAHLDSTSGQPSSKAPGADDNASGSVVVLEALRVITAAGFTPQNTLEFHWYAGEEIGLVGSADVFADYKSQGKTVLSYVNQDMTGYSPSGTPCVITDNADAGLSEYVTLLVTEFTGQAPNTDVCGYGCSDHASANANGFPAAFLFEDFFDESSPYVHTPNDTPDTIMWDAVERHVKFSVGYLVEASYL